MKYIILAQETERVLTKYDFDLTDKRNRRIGAVVFRWRETYADRPSDYVGPRYTDLDGQLKTGQPYHYVRVQATRNGIEYGACQSPARFETEEEADAYVAKYLKSAKSRAIRTALSY